MSRPAWEACDCCEDWICNIHGCHAHDCDCPPIDDWDIDPYSEGLDMTSDREMRYRKAQAERGEKRVTVWCPVDRIDELKAIAEKMREEHKPAKNLLKGI